MQKRCQYAKQNIGCKLVIDITTIRTKHQCLFVEINWLAFVKLTEKTKTTTHNKLTT